MKKCLIVCVFGAGQAISAELPKRESWCQARIGHIRFGVSDRIARWKSRHGCFGLADRINYDRQ